MPNLTSRQRRQAGSIGLLLAALLLAGCATQTYTLPSVAMEPSIASQSRLQIHKRAYRKILPQRLDVVAFRPSPHSKSIFIFRVVGLPGEHIEVKAGGCYANFKPVLPPPGVRYGSVPGSPVTATVLGPHEVFVLGDNHQRARDSRFLGPIAISNLLGKVIHVTPPD